MINNTELAWPGTAGSQSRPHTHGHIVQWMSSSKTQQVRGRRETNNLVESWDIRSIF